VRVGFFTGAGLPHVVVGAASLPAGLGAFFVAVGLLSIAAVWWPRVVADADGIEVRNVRAYRLAWSDVRRVRYERQPPYRARVVRWLVEHNPRGRGEPPPGLVVRGHGVTLAAWAAQEGVFAPFVAGVTPAEALADALADALRAFRRGDDPVAAVRARRRPLGWLARAAAGAAAGLLVGWWLVGGFD
jgi:hypothetical protein